MDRYKQKSTLKITDMFAPAQPAMFMFDTRMTMGDISENGTRMTPDAKTGDWKPVMPNLVPFHLFDSSPEPTPSLVLKPTKEKKPRKPRTATPKTAEQKAAREKKKKEATEQELKQEAERRAHASENAPWFQAVKAEQSILNKRNLEQDYEELTPEMEAKLLEEPGSYDLAVYLQNDLHKWAIGSRWDTPLYDKFEKMRIACITIIVNRKYFVFLRPLDGSRLFYRPNPGEVPPEAWAFLPHTLEHFDAQTLDLWSTLHTVFGWLDGARHIDTFNKEDLFGVLKFYARNDQRIMYWQLKTRDVFGEAYRQFHHSEIRLLDTLHANGMTPAVQPCDEVTMMKFWKNEKESERHQESKDTDQMKFHLTTFELEMLHWCNCVLRLNALASKSEVRVPTRLRTKIDRGAIDMQTMMCKWHETKNCV